MADRRLVYPLRPVIAGVLCFICALLISPLTRIEASSEDIPAAMGMPAMAAHRGAPEKVKVIEAYGRLPLYFVENKGQVNEAVRYYARGGGHTAFFTTDGVTFAGDGGDRVKLTLAGMGEKVNIVASAAFDGKVNRIVGNDPGKWVTDVPVFGSLTYTDVYPGVDLSFYGNNSSLEYDITLRPGADLSRVKFEYEGVEGLSVTEQGDMLVSLRGGDAIRQKKPDIYQELDGARVPVGGSFEILENEDGRFSYGFRVASHDPGKTLVIDPAITYASFLGGTGGEFIYAAAADSAGNVYVAGFTLSTDYPTTSNAVSKSSLGDHDCFVTKINKSGALVYSTFLGGSGYDTVFAMTVDSSGSIYLGGATGSSDFPIAGGGSAKKGSAAWTGFVSKINASGTLVYSTCLGGSGGDEVHALAVDSAGKAYVGGATLSSDFPTKNPLTGQESLHAGPCSASSFCMDAFVSVLDSTGALAFSTYLGGADDEQINAIAVDASGNIYVAGATNSSDFPVLNPLPGQGSFHAVSCGSRDCDDGFVAKISSTGTLVYSTYLGGSGEDEIASIAVDSLGRAYVAGTTSSTDFPTTLGAFRSSIPAKGTGFITKISASGSLLVFSTGLGGTGGDRISGMAVDSSGNIHVAGITASTDFPTTSNAIMLTSSNYLNMFVTKMNSSGSALIYSTYLNWKENEDDWLSSMALNSSGEVFLAGYTYSSYFPVTSNAAYRTHSANQGGVTCQAGFIVRISYDALQEEVQGIINTLIMDQE